MFKQLRKMDPQCANLLLRQTTMPRMGYLLRTVPWEILGPFLGMFDDHVEATFKEIAGLGDEISSLFLQAPFRQGGLGLRHLVSKINEKR